MNPPETRLQRSSVGLQPNLRYVDTQPTRLPLPLLHPPFPPPPAGRLRDAPPHPLPPRPPVLHFLAIARQRPQSGSSASLPSRPHSPHGLECSVSVRWAALTGLCTWVWRRFETRSLPLPQPCGPACRFLSSVCCTRSGWHAALSPPRSAVMGRGGGGGGQGCVCVCWRPEFAQGFA